MQKVLFILGELSDDDIEWMISKGKTQQVMRGTALINEGQPVDALYIILDGSVEILTRATGENEVANLGVGEMVGEMSFVDARPPSATVKAIAPATVFVIPRTELEAKMEEDPGFAARFYRAVAIFLSDRLRGTVSQLGYGRNQSLASNIEFADELDSNVLDNVYLAGARFDRMLKRLMTGR